ncbi:iron compound ABC uptake transporter substrate-binding protein PiuA [Photobacterium aphoticum]|uniref:Iron compound ABC uptake transporter substrate-binding protein PiuA n=1 Tax=Photobacterium aphoticum TaxID=754436 RepID=A0A090QLV5_9GAMM|nr:iron compound ABC uptake transporter substrate-binding protein PiuA [Photobacterium aphoticum]
MPRVSTLFKTVLLLSSFMASPLVSAESITVNHVLGSTVIPDTPERVIVVGGNGSLDVLHRLGIKPVGAVTTLMPDYLKDFAKEGIVHVGSTKEVDYEKIFTLKPDVIIAEARMVDAYPTLSSIAPTVMYTVEYGNYWEDTQRNWRMLGKIFNKEQIVEDYINETNDQFAAIQAQVKKNDLNTLAVMNNGNNVSMFGREGRFSVIFNEFGFKEAEGTDSTNPHGNLISFEFIAEAAPDVLFILDREQAIGASVGKAKTLFDNPLIKSTPAYKNNRIVYLNPTAWYISIAGMDATQIMIDDMNAVFSPKTAH